MSLLTDLLRRFRIGTQIDSDPVPGEPIPGSTERGFRPYPSERNRRLNMALAQVDIAHKQKVADIRDMDQRDGRVKKIHSKTARAAVKGGLKLVFKGTEDARINDAWRQFLKRCSLDNDAKLRSHARGTLIEGNLALQWVLDNNRQVAECVRMPSETIIPNADATGQFKDVNRAFIQIDPMTGQEAASFALWQMKFGRLDPDNWDDHGSYGRPYLDSDREVWRKLIHTEENLVIRRNHRAPLRMFHVLEGATAKELEAYRDEIEQDMNDSDQVKTDYYSNKPGSVSAIQGDENLDQIADVAYLLDTFFAGTPAPKSLFGYVSDARADVVEQLKRDYFDEVDALQDALAEAYTHGFCLDLLLQGINPDAYEFTVEFTQRMTETKAQRTDNALKLQAIGTSKQTAMEEAGINYESEKLRIEQERKKLDPYPDPGAIGAQPNVSITPPAKPTGDSSTTITNDSPNNNRLEVATRSDVA